MSIFRVNGERVSGLCLEEERNYQLRAFSEQEQQQPNDRLRLMMEDRVKRNVIDGYLLKQEAEKRGIQIGDEVVQEAIEALAEKEGGGEQLESRLGSLGFSVSELKRAILMRRVSDAYAEAVADSVARPKERHAKKYFEENRSDFCRPEEACVAVIAKVFRDAGSRRKALDDLKKIESAIRLGKSFRTMLRQKSDVPESQGLIGWVKKGKLPIPFDDFVFGSTSESLSEPIEHQSAWYLIKVEQRKEAESPGFTDVKEEITERLWQLKRLEKLRKLLEKLRSKANIEEI